MIPPRMIALGLAGTLLLAGCAQPTGPSPTAAVKTDLVLADAYELGGYNPIAGYGELGVSPFYDGLVALDSTNPNELPVLKPALAKALPTSNSDATQWKVTLRSGVTFHDGTAFDAVDVVATYKAVLDPASASDIASSFEMIQQVSAAKEDGQETVTFQLKYPYADFPARLLLGIAPSEKLTGGLASESSLNRQPVGTGPYKLAELSSEKAVFEANDTYWGGKPQVTKVTTLYLPDDNARVARVAAGEFDGTIVPPVLAKTFANKPGYKVVAAHSADWRGISFPSNNPFTKDPAVRIALNHAVDRAAIIKAVLDGHGTPAHTPVSSVYAGTYVADATFAYDVDKAKQMLDAAGWVPGADGIRAKGGDRASFSVAYRPTDSVRRDLAAAFAGEMKKIGVEVKLEGLDFAKIEPRVKELGILLGGGDKPYSIDTQVFGALHTPVAGASVWDNPSTFGSAHIDASLEKARKTLDAGARQQAYQQLQRDYLENPAYVFITFLDHTYVMKDSGWQTGNLTIEPHSHGVGWGPWWNLASWRR